MNPPDFSVLLLVWDDADPSVAVLGGTALPPTLPLVYQLATRQPVVAVYPHLPAEAAPLGSGQVPEPETSAPAAPRTGAVTPETEAAKATKEAIGAAAPDTAAALKTTAFDTAVPLPGVLLLPPPTTEATMVAAAPGLLSRIIGLANLAPANSSVAAPTQAAGSETALGTLPVAARSQWPTGADAPVAGRGAWQVPAAPYLGAEAVRGEPPSALTSPPNPLSRGEGGLDLASALFSRLFEQELEIGPPSARQRGLGGGVNAENDQPQASDPNPDSERPAVFDEPTAAMGSAEALDLSAPEDDLVPDAPVPTTARAAAVLPAAPEPAPAPEAATLALVSAPEDLNFRMIQYARQAARLVRGRADFGVIYAPSWPAWLAALEIRNSSGRPLVLYAAGLAADQPHPTGRGWQLELERMALRRAQLILVPDEALGHRLRARYGSSIGEVRVVAATDEPAVRQALGEVAAG